MASAGSVPRSGQPDVAPPFVTVGEVIAGKYRIERIVGQGGMGFVAEATHLELEERVALKFLHRSTTANEDIILRFRREARAAVKLKSEHVARVHDVGQCDDGSPFMVMEYLEGIDLAGLVERDGPLPIADAVDYVLQACEGLAEAHARGIIHRDIKPENLFLAVRSDGWKSVKVVDFGISKLVLTGPATEQVSHQTTSMMGSPFYMSPEQLRSTRSVDHRADVWSIGVTLFELLTGRTAFDETKPFTELLVEILEEPHRRIEAFRNDVPEGLVEVIDKCLAKDRNQRYGTIAEFALALLPFASRRARLNVERMIAATKTASYASDSSQKLRLPGSEAPPSMPASAPTGPNLRTSGARPVTPSALGGANTLPAPPLEGGSEAAPPARRALLLVVGVAIAGILGLVIFLAARRSSEPTGASGPSAASASPSSGLGATVAASAAPSSVTSAPSVTASAEAKDREVASVGSAATMPSAASSPSSHVKRGPAAPPPTTKHTTGPAGPDLDIRTQR